LGIKILVLVAISLIPLFIVPALADIYDPDSLTIEFVGVKKVQEGYIMQDSGPQDDPGDDKIAPSDGYVATFRGENAISDVWLQLIFYTPEQKTLKVQKIIFPEDTDYQIEVFLLEFLEGGEYLVQIRQEHNNPEFFLPIELDIPRLPDDVISVEVSADNIPVGKVYGVEGIINPPLSGATLDVLIIKVGGTKNVLYGDSRIHGSDTEFKATFQANNPGTYFAQVVWDHLVFRNSDFFEIIEPEIDVEIPELNGEGFFVTTTEKKYEIGDIIVIAGKVDEIIINAPLTFQVILLGENSEESIVEIAQVEVAQDGTFSKTIHATGKQWEDKAEYVVRAFYGVDHITETSFGIGIEPKEVKIEFESEYIPEPKSIPKNEPIPEPKPEELGFASFVDPEKDPQYYVDRYNTEPEYKKWFDENFPEYSSIFVAVGLEEPREKIPDWVKNIFIWYAEGQIGEDDLINALEFLINEGLIKVKT